MKIWKTGCDSTDSLNKIILRRYFLRLCFCDFYMWLISCAKLSFPHDLWLPVTLLPSTVVPGVVVFFPLCNCRNILLSVGFAVVWQNALPHWRHSLLPGHEGLPKSFPSSHCQSIHPRTQLARFVDTARLGRLVVVVVVVVIVVVVTVGVH